MPKPLKKKRIPPRDINQRARHFVELSTAEPQAESTEPSSIQAAALSAYMAELGRKGGRIGGKRRLETMTFEQRSAIGTKAARARWPPKRKGSKKR